MILSPASTVWVTPDLGVAIVPGDQEPWTETWYPPAAWAQYDKLCDTCKGDDQLHTYRCLDCRDGRQVWELRTGCPQPPSRDRAICSRCGRTRTSWDSPCTCPVTTPIVRFITTCGWGGCDRHSVRWRFDSDRGWLPVCDIHGSVPLGRFTVQVVPVVADAIDIPAIWPQADVLTVDGLGAHLYRWVRHDHWQWEADVSLNPLPVSGRDFAVIFRKVEP